jgi:hypothetical protein
MLLARPLAGFYYCAIERRTGRLLGFYFDQQSSPFQELELQVEHTRSSGAGSSSAGSSRASSSAGAPGTAASRSSSKAGGSSDGSASVAASEGSSTDGGFSFGRYDFA